jgi:hypothetical protein
MHKFGPRMNGLSISLVRMIQIFILINDDQINSELQPEVDLKFFEQTFPARNACHRRLGGS